MGIFRTVKGTCRNIGLWMAAVLLAVMAADLLIFAYSMDGGQAVLYVALHLVLLGAAIWQVLALRQLQQGGEKLAEGGLLPSRDPEPGGAAGAEAPCGEPELRAGGHSAGLWRRK